MFAHRNRGWCSATTTKEKKKAVLCSFSVSMSSRLLTNSSGVCSEVKTVCFQPFCFQFSISASFVILMVS